MLSRSAQALERVRQEGGGRRRRRQSIALLPRWHASGAKEPRRTATVTLRPGPHGGKTSPSPFQVEAPGIHRSRWCRYLLQLALQPLPSAA